MDKQLIAEFNKMYFGKLQIARRIYDKTEMEEVWKNIQIERAKNSINTNLKFMEEKTLWHNQIKEIDERVDIVNQFKESDILNYIPRNDIDIFFKEMILNEAENIAILSQFDVKNIFDALINIFSQNNEFNRQYIIDVYDQLLNSLTKSSECKQDINIESLDSLLQYVLENKKQNPIITSAIVQFYVIYNNMFGDYSKAMARIIDIMVLVKGGYGILGYCNITKLINSESKKYNNAIKNSMDSEGDITYFIKYYTLIIIEAKKEFNRYVNDKYGKKIIKLIIEENDLRLEERHIKFINLIMSSTSDRVTIEDYKNKVKVSYETARTDLNYLVTLGFFKIAKVGKKYEYYKNDISTIVDSFQE